MIAPLRRRILSEQDKAMTRDHTLPQESDSNALLDALADVVDCNLGGQGTFPQLGTERTEEILLILLRAGKVVRAHNRAWTIPIPPADIAAARAAGGFLSFEEYVTNIVAGIDREILSAHHDLDLATTKNESARLTKAIEKRRADREYYLKKIAPQQVAR